MIVRFTPITLKFVRKKEDQFNKKANRRKMCFVLNH